MTLCLCMCAERVLSVQCHSHHKISFIILQPQLQIGHGALGRKKSPCWVRPGVEAGTAPSVPFHCSWLWILLPRCTQQCSRLGFLKDIRFYCTADAISVPPCLAALQRSNKCLPPPPTPVREDAEEEEEGKTNPTAAGQRGREDITASQQSQVSRKIILTQHSKASKVR